MKTIAATELKARLSEFLGDVERGEVINVTRHGRTIARIVPTNEDSAAQERRKAVDALTEWRKTLPPTNITVEEILEWRHEGHRY